MFSSRGVRDRDTGGAGSVAATWGPEALPGKGVGSQELPLRVGPVGSLVLRPKPSPIGSCVPFPEGTGRVGIRGFSLTEPGP